jgi:hypothetical protein
MVNVYHLIISKSFASARLFFVAYTLFTYF